MVWDSVLLILILLIIIHLGLFFRIRIFHNASKKEFLQVVIILDVGFLIAITLYFIVARLFGQMSWVLQDYAMTVSVSIMGGLCCSLGIFKIIKYRLSEKHFDQTAVATVMAIDIDRQKGRDIKPTYEYVVDGHTYRKQFDPATYNLNEYCVG